MQDGLLRDSRGGAAAHWPPVRPGLFHNKAFVFRDSDGNVVAAVGSPNETGAGLGQNFEHLTVFSSWEQPRYTDAQVRFFESLWSDQQAGSIVRELDAGFAEEILAALPARRRPAVDAGSGAAARCARYSTSPRPCRPWRWCPATMPRSTRIRSEPSSMHCRAGQSESSWPTRWASGRPSRRAQCSSTCSSTPQPAAALVLAPKGVVYQWQAELSEHFELDAWVFDSGRRAIISPERRGSPARSRRARPQSVDARQSPSCPLSTRAARDGQGHALASATQMPDVLIVDEAHAARVRPDLAGDERPTLMWRLLNDLMPKVPHVVFATATPMQMHWREYHALLELLGLPEAWTKPANYERSLQLRLRGRNAHPAGCSAGRGTGLLLCRGDAAQSGAAGAPLSADFSSGSCSASETLSRERTMAKAAWPTTRRLLTKLHPAHLLTVRNTRIRSGGSRLHVSDPQSHRPRSRRAR